MSCLFAWSLNLLVKFGHMSKHVYCFSQNTSLVTYVLQVGHLKPSLSSLFRSETGICGKKCGSPLPLNVLNQLDKDTHDCTWFLDQSININSPAPTDSPTHGFWSSACFLEGPSDVTVSRFQFWPMVHPRESWAKAASGTLETSNSHDLQMATPPICLIFARCQSKIRLSRVYCSRHVVSQMQIILCNIIYIYIIYYIYIINPSPFY